MATFNTVQEDLVSQHVRRWVELHNTIKQFQDQIKEHKDAQKIVEGQIIQSMKENKLSNFDLPNGKELKLKIVESKKSVPLKVLKTELAKCHSPGNSKEQVLFLVKELYKKLENRPITKTEKLQYSD